MFLSKLIHKHEFLEHLNVLLDLWVIINHDSDPHNNLIYLGIVSTIKSYFFVNFLVQLLHKFSVRAAETSAKLMKVIKNPITDHLPAGCRKVATSFSAEKPIKPSELVPQDAPIAFIVGAMAHGQVFKFIND